MKSNSKFVRTTCGSGWVNLKSTVRFGISALILAFAAFSAFAQKETPPPGGQPKPFVFPKQDNFTLPNGMQVTLVQYGSVPKVAIQAIVRAGHINEKPDQNWVSDITALMLKEGTSTRSAEQIGAKRPRWAARYLPRPSTDSTTVGGEVLSEFDTRFVDLLVRRSSQPEICR